MRPVVAYRHKLRWKLWRLWSTVWSAIRAFGSMAIAVIAGLLAVIGILAITIGHRFLPPYHHEDLVGRVVAIGPVRAGPNSRPIALVRIGADVARFEGPEIGSCRVGDYINVRNTYSRRGRGLPDLLRTEPTSDCRPLP